MLFWCGNAAAGDSTDHCHMYTVRSNHRGVFVQYLRVKNWQEFQHYKDRSPPWIKIYRELLTDYNFSTLPDHIKGQLLMIWILASQLDNKIPYDAIWLKGRISATESVDIELLIDLGFLLLSDSSEENTCADSAQVLGSRYVNKQIKAFIFERDKGQCCACKTNKKIEFDHIIPISKGGLSTAENLQLLCTSCNRKKRMRSTSYAAAEQLATQMWSLETETYRKETETKTEREHSQNFEDLVFSDKFSDGVKKRGLSLEVGMLSFEKWKVHYKPSGPREDWLKSWEKWILNERIPVQNNDNEEVLKGNELMAQKLGAIIFLRKRSMFISTEQEIFISNWENKNQKKVEWENVREWRALGCPAL